MDMPKTWKNVKTFDDTVIKEERKMISNLEKEAKARRTELCPFVKKIGKFFYYCAKDLKEEVSNEPSPRNPVYQRKISVADLHWWCLGDYNKCSFCIGELKR